MGANAFEYNVKLNLNAETKMARAQIGELQKELQSISQLKINTAGIDKLTSEIHEASNAALTLQANLQSALNPDTGNLDFSKFISSINKSGNSVNDLAESLLKVGPQGSKAFMSLADSISRAEIPLTRTNKLINGLWDNLKKTAGWQVSSSVIHGIMGTYQQAMGYAQALDKSLTDIRIVTGQSADQMARFAKEANAAAKKLSTTTTDYTNASLIYYQQGLSDSEVKKRSDITIKMANATGTTASKVSDQLTSIWNNFDNGTKSLEHYADVMTALGAATASSTDEIAKGIQKFAAISDTVGLSYEYAASALATITATTRESADTVGNSLKTLFSRIQGLQLGETLDDGTTLNKYSTALAKVGISIKDSSGALKDMNSILDEMGSKWHTLAEDQQMALAQTVGGVRQYTQIMTLMENWDFFKENLTTANTASGALTQQAEIYAESWEAAQSRMKASMEGLWDTLIDSDSFKSLLNIGSTIVNGITDAIAGLGSTGGIITTLGGILGTVFNTQISSAIEDGIYNIGALLNPKGAKQRAIDQKREVLTRMSDSIIDQNSGLEGRTYKRVLDKQAAEMEDRERHRQMMAKENHDVDARYEEQLKEIRQKEIDFARQIDQGENQFNAAMDSFDDFETAEGTEKPLKTISDAEWQNRQEQYIRAQENANKTGGKKDRAANVAKAQSDLLYAAAIMSGQNFGDGIDFTKEVQSWADRTLSQDADFNSILSQFRTGVAKRTDAEIAAGQEGGRYYKAELTANLQKAIGTLLGGDNTSQDQGVAKAYEIFDKQITDTIAGLEKKGLIDPEGKILAGHEDEVISSLSNIIETVQNGTYNFNRERILSQVRSKGGKLAIDSAYQGALTRGQGQQGFNQAEADERRKEEDRRRLESNVAKATSIAVGAGSGLFSTAGAIQGFEGALQSDNFLGFAAGIGSGIFNLQQGRQHYSDAFSKLSPFGEALQKRAQKTGLLQQQVDLQESVRSNQYWRKIEEANLEKIQKEYNQKKTKGTMVDHEYYEQEIARREASIKKRKNDEENAAGQLNNVAEGLEKLKNIDTTKFPRSMGKVGDVLDFASKNADKVAAGFQAAQMAMKLTSEGLEYIYNTNQRNATKAATSAAELENAYAMNQRNHSNLLASIDEYNQATDKLIDTNLKGAEKSAAIYEQNSIAMDLISKYNLSEKDYTRMGDTIKINEDALERAQEESIQNMSISKYAMNAAKVDAKEAQNQYQEERLEREMGYDEKVAHGIATGIAGVTGMIAGAKLGATLGSFAGPVGALIGAAAGVAIGGVVTAVTNEAKEDSIVDKAVALTRETGSTKWMDDEDALARSGLSERQLKKIKEQREEIQQLADSEYAAEQADRLEKENTAKDIIRTDEELKDFKHADKLTEGLIREQEDWYSKQNMETYNFWDTKKKKIDVAKSLEDELGLGGEQVTWEDNWRNGQLTYTTASGETGVLSYDTMAKMEATKKGKEGTDQYIDTMMDTYDAIKTATGGNEDAAAGMLSLLSGGDFEAATVKEMEAAKELLGGLSTDVYGDFGFYDQYGNLDFTKYSDFAKSLGLTFTEGDSQSLTNALNEYATSLGYEHYGELFNTLGAAQNYSSPILDMMTQFTGAKQEDGTYSGGQYSEWFNNQGQAIFGSMDQATMKEFYKELSYISATQGEDAGLNYLNGLSGILQDVKAEDMGKAVRAMLAVDWEDWDNLDTSIIDTMKEFGVTIDNDSEALKNFVAVTRATANAIPNLEKSMTSLIQAAGSLEGVKIGDKISDATIEALKAQGYDLSDETFSTFSGDNVVIGDTEHILQGIRNEVASTYATYNATRDKVDNVLTYNHDERVDKLRGMSQEDFINDILPQYQGGGAYSYNDAYYMAKSVLGEKGSQALNDAITQRQTAQTALKNYQVDASGNITRYKDESGNWVEFSSVTDANEKAKIQNQYDTYKQQESDAQWIIDQSYESIKAAMDAAQDPAEAQKIAEQYVSTFSSFNEAMADATTQQMLANGDLTESDALMYYASKYPELTEYVNAYNHALEHGSEQAQKETKAALEKNIAMQDQLALYKKLTGKKTDLAELQGVMDKLKETMAETDSPFEGDDAELATLAGEAMIAAEAYGQLQKNSGKWLANLKESGPAATEAAEKIGTLLQSMLGLSDLKNITRDNLISVVKNFDPELLQKAMNGDRLAGLQFGKALALQANGGFLQDKINAQKDGTDPNTKKLDKTIDAIHKFFVDSDIGGLSDLKGLKGKKQEEWAALNQDLFEASGGDWETYQAAAEAAGFTARKQDFTHQTVKDGKLIDSQLKYVDGKYYWVDQNGNATAAYNENDYKPNNPTLPIVKGRPVNGPGGGPKLTTFDRITADNPSPTTPTAPANTTGMPSVQDVMGEAGNANATVDAAGNVYKWTGGGGGGGGGGGPTKVAVKSAQELMTRYKTIDAKSAIVEMQKANALTQKDLLYGEAKIAQLQKINGLLVKQQRLTADRIEEERQYLEEDKKHLQEVLDRYNKDKKDKDGKVKEGEELLELEFNSEGIITNYKQTIGAMAEELAAFYRDGELTSEEGKKAEELQKKIADLNVVIQDYEDSLNQLQTSIDTYEQTLYEMFANQAEELAYKVTYKLEMENDDLTYVKFYATALKDSTDRMYDYIDLIGQQAGEFKDQIEVYNQGVEDLISNAENNPMYTFATGGLEGVLTAEDVTNLRTYRDGLNTTYTSMVALRKEVEEKVLKVFDEWHDKVNKNVDSISRYTDMLSQFKDVINVIGKETLGLSDAFMKNFEQKSIDQSRDNIEAAKQQYESLAEIYANAQDKLEAARADGNEETIKHWEEVVDQTQSEMESAQDTILTTLNHTLNLIAEQFTNAINEAIDTFNESIYEFGGLDGLIADYEQIREQRDLMVEDYEKIYSLNKLNRQIEKTLDDTKIIAGKQKLLEFQEKINDLNRNNVELSKFELEYLQAEYELRLAEIELENARTAKDTVRLSRDSEGNWSYIYTQNESAIDEAQQKYEDALYKMQQTTQEYQNEMSASMMDVAQRMRDEIAELNIQELGPEKFQEEMDRIKEKYAEQLAFYENELNKSISTSKNLYDEDWQNYSAATGYKLSAAQDWADSYSETTLGGLMGSGQYMSDYASTIMASADVMTESMSQAATTYFNESNKALETYGTSIEGFATHLQTTTSQITASSKQATADVTTMAADMVDAFSKVADEVKNWQDTFGEEISMLLDEIGNRIQEINDLIKKSNELGKNNYSSTDLIGQAEAIELINKETFNNKNLFGTWTFDEENGVARGTYTDASGEVKQDVERNIVEFTGQLVEMIDELTGKYYDAKTDSPEREMYGEQLKKLFQDYWKFKNIVNRIYDLTDITIPEPKLDKDKVEGLATGGYTGEWGDSGKLAFLHEKELVLNKDDTANFLDALNISRQLVEMIEMNARASSLGLGEMYASSIQDHNQTLEQSVSITAEFPNATDHSEIEEAFDNLINMASQYAYRN